MRIEPQIDSGRREPRINDNNLLLWLNDNGKTASNWYDQSGKNNHGLVYGAGTPPPATPGALGYDFDGVDDYVNVGNNASLNFGTGDFTISAWVQVSSIAELGYTIYSKHDAALTDSAGYAFQIYEDDLYFFRLDGASGAGRIQRKNNILTHENK